MHTEEKLTEEQQLGLKIEGELEALYDSGVVEISAADLEQKAKTTFDEIIKVYAEEAEEENGVETSRFKIVQVGTDTEKFKIIKND